MGDQTRNLNPSREAVAAMWLFSEEYPSQRGGSMDFYDSLTDSQKRLCKDMVEQIIKAPPNTEE